MWRIAPWIGLGACAVALAAVAVQLATARAEISALRGWQGTMLRQLEAAGGSATAGQRIAVAPDAAPEALSRIIAARDGALLMTAAAPGRPATGIPAAADGGDGNEISRLNQTQSTGSAAGDARIIEQDSQAAWTGWE